MWDFARCRVCPRSRRVCLGRCDWRIRTNQQFGCRFCAASSGFLRPDFRLPTRHAPCCSGSAQPRLARCPPLTGVASRLGVPPPSALRQTTPLARPTQTSSLDPLCLSFESRQRGSGESWIDGTHDSRAIPTTIPRCPGARPWFTVRLTDSQPRHLISAPTLRRVPSCSCFWCKTMQSFDVSASRGVLYRFISATLPQTPPPTWFRGLFLRPQGVISQSYRRLCKCQSGKASGTAQRGCAMESWLPCLPSHRGLATMEAALSFVLAPRCLLSAVDALLASLDLVRSGIVFSFKHCLSFLPPVATLAQLRLHCRITKTPPSPPWIPWSRRPFDLTHTKHTAGMPWTRRLLVVESLLACQ